MGNIADPPMSAVFFNRPMFDIIESPPVSSAIRASNQGVASFPRLLMPFSSDSVIACSTDRWMLEPICWNSSGIGTAINVPFSMPNCHCESEKDERGVYFVKPMPYGGYLRHQWEFGRYTGPVAV